MVAARGKGAPLGLMPGPGSRESNDHENDSWLLTKNKMEIDMTVRFRGRPPAEVGWEWS